jgi:hypothetical protein
VHLKILYHGVCYHGYSGYLKCTERKDLLTHLERMINIMEGEGHPAHEPRNFQIRATPSSCSQFTLLGMLASLQSTCSNHFVRLPVRVQELENG